MTIAVVFQASPAKGQIQAEVKEKLQNELTNSNIGMMVVNLSVQDAEPPTEEIVQAFQTVRDQVVFTNKRIFVVNVQGITGKRNDLQANRGR